MDGVELPLPPAVVVSKLMGSEGFGGGGAEVIVKDVGASVSDRVSLLVSPRIDTCSSFCNKKVNASESAFWNKMPNSELNKHASQPPSLNSKDVPEELIYGNKNSSLLLAPNMDAKHLKRKSGKVVRVSNGCSKRARTAQMDVSKIEPGADDVKEKNQMAKQKNNLNGKRGDKRNGKLPKNKYDSFSLKNGLVSLRSAAGGNSILGVYGSKPDIFDVTKHVDELSLNELLDGNYRCPSLAKDKGKKEPNYNENFFHSVRKACSILWLQKPVQPQNCAEIDFSYNGKISTCLVSSDPSLVSKSDIDKGDTCTTDLSSCNEVQASCSKLKSTADVLDLPLCQPKDILERLALPPPKDLESLLLDAAKPTLYSRNNSHIRLGKPISNRPGLPPFTWSHNSGGHCKSNFDAVKLSTSRGTCQGRWVKVENSLSSLGVASDFIAGLESLTYNHSLVPSGGLKTGPSDSENVPSSSTSFALCEQGLLSSVRCSDSQDPSASHSPSILAAAQTLYEISTHSLKQNPGGMRRWPNKSSQKTMKACKLKSNETSEKIFAALKSTTVPDNMVKIAEQFPPKKLKISVNKKSCDLSHTNAISKETMNWSTPRSSRSSPSKSFKLSVAETKHNNTNMVKKSCMLPPSTRL